ncbi:putative catechol protein [Lasiodiplodia theobromae]|uniref:Hydroxyquinol 1,2-dioxygenase n=1 Tax=Lasiodiplodia theobromae TaxID=45133 RepID=A0A5N5CX93_9PEZI|nr:Catechol dioxygenase [Lasiodiplodia theobromae]KAB2569926.1 Hydroxyquinol 1,2-dioxygenase [Lasiodiplodia theobromae]KAF4535066.1 Catechol dioxygenase [Lasiodiplodia theobromae]KAF9631582.1 putative catechol protein [Lasiodiplodia theobromae]
MDPSQVDIPPLKDLTIDNITDNVHLINSRCPNPRLKYILERLVVHAHDFARETRLSTDEWMTGIQFLTEVGQICSDVRQEFILLSDIIGLSLLVDSIDHPKPPHSTEGTVLGPFHTLDAHGEANGSVISHDPDGEPCLVLCSVKDTAGNPIEGVKIDVWETDSKGFYDVQYKDRKEPDGRAVLVSDKDGIFWFKAIVPVPYPIPHDGPVGKLLKVLKRHPYRPSHMHFMFAKEGFDNLITALYLRNDPYETSDAVFGVKETLLVDLHTVDAADAKKYGVKEGSKLMKYDFVLVTEDEAKQLREKKAMEAMEAQGRKMKLWNGLPVPDVD